MDERTLKILRILNLEVRTYEDIQKLRIALGHRYRNLTKKPGDLSRFFDILKKNEYITKIRIHDLLQPLEPSFSIIKWLLGIRGISDLSTGQLLTGIMCLCSCEGGLRTVWKGKKWHAKRVKEMCPYWQFCRGNRDIRRFPTVSSLWAYLRLDPRKKKKGESTKANESLRAYILGRMGPAFLGSHSPYASVYYARRNQTENREDWSGGRKHADADANRIMMKRFLGELFNAWYVTVGLTPPEPYVSARLCHQLDPPIVPPPDEETKAG